MNTKKAISQAKKILKEHHVCRGSDPAREAEDIVATVLGVSKTAVLIHPETELTEDQEKQLGIFLTRRQKHMPLAYLLGTAPFMGRDYTVSAATLIPRPATETLTANALATIEKLKSPKIVDVGTGSGCIAITLALESKSHRVFATDISEATLNTAEKNAETLGADLQIAFRLDDVLNDTLTDLEGSPLVVVANLPYIPSEDMQSLDAEIKDYEPSLALDGGDDGLILFYRLIDQLATLNLKKKPLHIFAEMLPEQATTFSRYATRKFPEMKSKQLMGMGEVLIGLHLWLE